jgi:hypothetical protein
MNGCKLYERALDCMQFLVPISRMSLYPRKNSTLGRLGYFLVALLNFS